MSRRPVKRRWLKMGVELEGSWIENYRNVAQRVSGASGKADGSVQHLDGYAGEIVTRPHAILDHLIKDVRDLYPNKVNYTCGFHIHASFSVIDTSALADVPFWDYYQARWHAWGENNQDKMDKASRDLFWTRLEGRMVVGAERNYCQMKFKPVEQLVDHNDRYTALNFVAYHKYKTVESRLLPMFANVEIAVSAIRELSDIYDSYLNKVGYPVIDLSRQFGSDGDVLTEEVRLKMPSRAMSAESFTVPSFKRQPSGPDVFYHVAGAEGMMLPFAETIATPTAEDF